MALDAEDLKKVSEMIAATLGADALTKALGPVLDPLVKAATAPLMTEIEALKKAKPADDGAGAGAGDGKGKGKKEGEGVDAATATEIAQLRAQFAESEKKRLEAETGAKRSALETTVRNQLGVLGIPADRMKHALASLQADGVFHEHNGAWHWKGKVGSVDGVHALDAGLADWMKGEGRVFLPAVQAAGTGKSETIEAPRTQTGGVDWDKLPTRMNTGLLSQVE